MEPRLTRIERNEVLSYLGYRGGGVPEEIGTAVDRCALRIMETARPRAVWRRFGLLPDGTLKDTEFRPEGDDVRALLDGCGAAVLMAATLGAEAEALIRRTQVTDMADAVILDACASAAIENVCDNLCADIEAELAPLYLTDRFSPGYGDMPLSQQEALCRVLSVERRIGVSLSPGGIMIPQKSVTAIMGLTPVPTPKRRGCMGCRMFENCSYRKDGGSCGAF